MIKSNYNTLTIILLFLLITGISCSDDEEFDETNMGQTATVEAAELRFGALPLVHRATGEMRARNQVEIYPEIDATITSVNVNDGDRVAQGDTLAQLRDEQIREQLNQAQYDRQIAEAQLRQAQAELRRLEAQLERTRELTERDLESPLELETLLADIDASEANVDLNRSQMERAESEIEEQKSNLENTVVKAPVSGLVGNRDAEIGQRADQSSMLFQIGDTDNMRIHVMLTEEMSAFIEPGQRAELVSGTVNNNPVEAVVERISPFLDPVTHTTTAQLEVKEGSENLRPGMFVTIDIFYGESEESTLIPETALYEHPTENETGIYIADMSGIEQEFDFEDEGDQSYQMTSETVPVEFIPVEVVAEGRGVAGISGIDPRNNWVITVGQHQLAEWGSEEAYVRRVDWEHVLELQTRQTRDMESIIFGDNNDD